MNLNLTCIFITPGLDEIRETYFYDVPENVPDEFPTVHRACLLMAAFDGETKDLVEHLGWTFEPHRYDDLFYSREDRAAFLKHGGEVYLFTFDELSSFEAGIAEIRQACRRLH